jgi:hypothetical protein
MAGEEISWEDRRRFVSGLDLGQAKDFTALAILERIPQADTPNGDRQPDHYAVRHLERPPLGTSYPAVVARVQSLFARHPLAQTTLAVDQTGVGRAVVDLLAEAQLRAELRPVTITGGHKAAPGEGMGWLVPKKELVGTLQVLLQARRLHVARHLAEAQTLIDELMLFQVKVTAAANETFGTWREGRHDDLVLAVAIAAWAGENLGVGRYEIM